MAGYTNIAEIRKAIKEINKLLEKVSRSAEYLSRAEKESVSRDKISY